MQTSLAEHRNESLDGVQTDVSLFRFCYKFGKMSGTIFKQASREREHTMKGRQH